MHKPRTRRTLAALEKLQQDNREAGKELGAVREDSTASAQIRCFSEDLAEEAEAGLASWRSCERSQTAAAARESGSRQQGSAEQLPAHYTTTITVDPEIKLGRIRAEHFPRMQQPFEFAGQLLSDDDATLEQCNIIKTRGAKLHFVSVPNQGTIKIKSLSYKDWAWSVMETMNTAIEEFTDDGTQSREVRGRRALLPAMYALVLDN